MTNVFFYGIMQYRLKKGGDTMQEGQSVRIDTVDYNKVKEQAKKDQRTIKTTLSRIIKIA